MALVIYPTVGYDSFISEVDATAIITLNSVQNADWIALSVEDRELYLRISTTRIFNVISTDSTSTTGYLDSATYVAADSCIPKINAMMSIYDLSYALSSDINPNRGNITKEKVGDLAVEYQHRRNSKGIITNPYPVEAVKCLNTYGANISSSSSLKQVTLVRG